MSQLLKKIKHLEAVRERLEFHINAQSNLAVATKQKSYLDGNLKRFEKEADEIKAKLEGKW